MPKKTYTREELRMLGFSDEEIDRALAKKNEVSYRKAIGYIRVSTEKQAKDDKFGVAAQKQAIEDYARKHQYTIVEWFEETISGVKDERPIFNKIINNELDIVVDAVVVYKSDRVARDTKLYFYYLYRLDKLNIKLVSTIEEFDEGNEIANIYRAIIQFVAEQERLNILRRTSGGKKQKFLAGGWSAGRIPIGYKSEKGVLIVDENTAPIVQQIFRLRRGGMSYQRICDELNRLGLLTNRGNPWYPSSVLQIIKDERVYCGYVKYGSHGWRRGVHQPLIKEIAKLNIVESKD